MYVYMYVCVRNFVLSPADMSLKTRLCMAILTTSFGICRVLEERMAKVADTRWQPDGGSPKSSNTALTGS
jgi:hypothetical protein